MAGRMTNGTYEYDILGRLTRKAEAGSDIVFDYVDGGYRMGADGAALFPLTDAQGSIRGYANLSGVRSAHAYYPYGSVEDLSVDAPEDARRWQSKEFDGALGNYYFGARYYDPLLGLWMSPDPAGQFSNPYGYGGDPVNYVDPTGMWALGLGIVVGWDSQHGWQIGFGAALDLSNGSPGNGFGANLSYTWNQDDSESFNMGASGQYYWLAGGLSYSYNSYTGQTFSGNIGVCVGLKGMVSVGPEIGGSLYVNHEGDIMGATAYAELQASAFGGLTSAAVGYESGSVGMESRGLFAGATVAGIHGELSHLEDGVDGMRGDIGFQEILYYEMKNLGQDPKTKKPRKYVGLSIPALGIFGDYFMYDHGNRNDNQKEVMGKDGKGISRKQFEKLAKDNDLDYGKYPWIASLFHPSNTDKMWMEKKSIFSFLYGWFWIPSVEGLFFPGGDYASAPSYNYGHNLITHALLDWIPYFVMDRWFPNP